LAKKSLNKRRADQGGMDLGEPPRTVVTKLLGPSTGGVAGATLTAKSVGSARLAHVSGGRRMWSPDCG
jgi:hypothetical protein